MIEGIADLFEKRGLAINLSNLASEHCGNVGPWENPHDARAHGLCPDTPAVWQAKVKQTLVRVLPWDTPPEAAGLEGVFEDLPFLWLAPPLPPGA